MRYKSILIALVAICAFVNACEKSQVLDVPVEQNPEINPNPAPQLQDNTYIIDEALESFGSVVMSNLDEYLCIAASPAEGVEDFEAIFEQDEYFYVAISPLLNAKEFDLMTPNAMAGH